MRKKSIILLLLLLFSFSANVVSEDNVIIECGDNLCYEGEDISCPEDCEQNYYDTITPTNSEKLLVKLLIVAIILFGLISLISIYQVAKKIESKITTPKVEVIWDKKKRSVKKKSKRKKR